MPTITKQQLEMYYPNGWRPDEHFLIDSFMGSMPYWDHCQPCDCRACVHTLNCKKCFKSYNYIMRLTHWIMCVGDAKKETFKKEANGNADRAMILAHTAGKKYVEALDVLNKTNWKTGTSAWLCPCFRKVDAPSSKLGIDWDDILVNGKTGVERVRYVDSPRKVQVID